MATPCGTASTQNPLPRRKCAAWTRIALARTNASRLAELLKDYKNMSLADFVSASNALNNYLDRIQSLSRAQRFMYRNQTTLEQALEELARIPVEED
jgi:hypothetical protein